MNENTSQPPPPPPQNEARTEPPPCPFQTINSAWQRGKQDARNAAQEAVPRIKAAAADAAYWLTYGVSFATVFQVTLARKLTPEIVKKGFRDGKQEGAHAADEFVHQCKTGHNKADSSDSSSSVPNPA